MKKIFSISTLAGFLMAGVIVARELIKTGEARWYIIALAAVLAIVSTMMKDEHFLGQNPKTSIIGYVQLILSTAYEAFLQPTIDWSLVLGSLAIAILARLSGDSSNANPK